MIAYNKIWLDNLAARDEVEDAFYVNAISKEETQQAESVFTVGFYSPNYFIRAGLFILAIIIGCFSLGLLSLLFLSAIEQSFGGLLVFFGLVSYAALEFFVQTKHHYRSGVDDALLLITGISIFSGINLMADISTATNALIIFILATYFFLRFADMLMSAVAGVALLAVFFLNYIPLGSIAETTAPFLLMLVTVIIYFLIKRIRQRATVRHYWQCCSILEIVMLICLYAVSNYYVVRETANSMFGAALNNAGNIPFGWLFWIFTICTPLIYIIWGIQKKDSILIRVGLLLIAAIVFTIRYYYTVMPVELVMLLGGIILIVISYALTKYLAQPKNGFTSAEVNNGRLKDKMNIEGLIIAESFGGGEAAGNPKFGGGSFGGGGASGDF